jgi:signal transduction histidine kinase
MIYKQRQWLVAIVSSTILSVWCAVTNGQTDKPDTFTLTQFERLYTDNQFIPPDPNQAGWQAVTLKDLWQPERRAEHLEAWYRTTFTLQEIPEEPWAFSAGRISSAAGFWLNGVEVGRSAEFTDPLPNAWNLPVFIQIPASAFQSGTNTLEIRYLAERSRLGYLYEINLGPAAKLLPAHQLSHFAKITAAQILTGIVAVAAILLAVLIYYTKQPQSYIWFMFGFIGWVIYSLHLYWVYFPFPIRVLHFLYMNAQIGAVICFIVAVHRTLKLHRRQIEIGMAALQSVVVIGTLLVSDFQLSNFYLGVQLACVILISYLGATLIFYGIKQRHQGRLWMAIAGIPIIVMTWYDFFMYVFRITAVFAKYPFIPVIAVFCGGAIFLMRFLRTQREVSDLKTTFELEKEAIAASAIAQERQRLMQDIHDGVGGQIATTLSLLEKEQADNKDVMELLRTSLDDLRMIIQSLETMGQTGNIVSILATMRERMEAQLNRHGIAFEWAVKPLPSIPRFGSSESLQLMRIVQEALTNTIKHSNANKIRLSCDQSQQQIDGKMVEGVHIVIEDNGKNNEQDLNVKLGSYGLNNMRQRSKSLNGDFNFSLLKEGAHLRLWLPIEVDKNLTVSASNSSLKQT